MELETLETRQLHVARAACQEREFCVGASFLHYNVLQRLAEADGNTISVNTGDTLGTIIF